MVNRAVEVSNVSKWFYPSRPLWVPFKAKSKIQVLSNINLEIPQGNIFALVGTNGAGKTTLFKIISTLLLPDEGEVWVNGHHHLHRPEKIRAILSFAMGGERGFYWRLSVRQNLEFFCTLYELPPRESRKKIVETARFSGLDEYLDRPYEQLSAGTRQRLGIARSLLNGAKVLLLDEPTRSLDPLSKRDVKTLLKKLSREYGKTIAFTTHDLHEAEEVADTIAILHKGQLRAVGKPDELRGTDKQSNFEETFAKFCEDRVIHSNVP